MLSKHITTVDSIEREIQQFRCFSITADDTLAWWAKQRQTFPRLTELARYILAIPTTSAPAKRVFSQAGLIINAKWSSLAPNNVNKIIFVHDNAHLLC